MNEIMMETSGNGGKLAAAPHAQEVVRAAEQELRELLGRRAEVVKRIGTLKQTLAGLANLYGDSVLSDELQVLLDRRPDRRQRGFTQACRSILMRSPVPLTARRFSEEIERAYPGLLANHKDPVASITTVLNRLVSYAEARSLITTEGRRAWLWAAESEHDGRPADWASTQELKV
jgi:hypothetical protein